jgi:predicted DNA-binding transcriptional regulator YafY
VATVGRGDSLARQHRLMRMLDERREVSVSAAAKDLGCDRKTIYRDFVVLEEIGVPLFQDGPGPRSRWRIVDGPKRKLALTLSWSEMLALTTGRDLLVGLAGTFFHEAAVGALDKIRAALPEQLATRAQAAADILMSDRRVARDYRSRGDVVREIADAIHARQTVALTYRKLGARRPEERLVDPYHLNIHAGALYLVGYCHRRRALRTFLLDRATGVRTTGDLFARRPELDPTAILQGDIGPWSGRAVVIRLRFAASVARLIAERKIHPSQVSQWRNNETLDVELRAPVTPALERWLLGWAGDVEILAPVGLRRSISERHRRAIGAKIDDDGHP